MHILSELIPMQNGCYNCKHRATVTKMVSNPVHTEEHPYDQKMITFYRCEQPDNITLVKAVLNSVGKPLKHDIISDGLTIELPQICARHEQTGR